MGVPIYLHPLAATLFPEHIVATWAEHAPKARQYRPPSSPIVEQPARARPGRFSPAPGLTTRRRRRSKPSGQDFYPRQRTRSHTCLLEQSGSLENP